MDSAEMRGGKYAWSFVTWGLDEDLFSTSVFGLAPPLVLGSVYQEAMSDGDLFSSI